MARRSTVAMIALPLLVIPCAACDREPRMPVVTAPSSTTRSYALVPSLLQVASSTLISRVPFRLRMSQRTPFAIPAR
jgi:hypothetical protein